MQPSKEYRNESGNGALGDWLEEVDDGLGAILALVNSLGIDQQTLISSSPTTARPREPVAVPARSGAANIPPGTAA